MDKRDWFELLECANNLTIAVNGGDTKAIIEMANSLINMIHYKSGCDAESCGWYNELEVFVDSLPLGND